MQLSQFVPRALSVYALSALLSLSFAAEKVLCVVTNDIDKETGRMVYELDDEQRVIKHLYKEKWVNNKLVERIELEPKDLLGDGLVLHRKDKYITVRLHSNNFDESRGGTLFLDTLYNGVSGVRKEYVINVDINGDQVRMSTTQGEFKTMHFVAKRSPVLGPIGIEKVVFSK